MKRSQKDHRRLICDTSALMQTTYFTVFFCALAHDVPKDEHDALADAAQEQLDRFVETNRTNEEIENFCLNVLTGRLPIYNDKGKVANPRRRP